MRFPRLSTISTTVSMALLSLAAMSAHAQTSTDACKLNCFQKRWVYYGGNITSKDANGVQVNLNTLLALIPRAKAAGYNGIALNAGGSGSYTTMLTNTKPSNFDASFATLLQVAAANGMPLIPVGGGPEVPVSVDPQLIEALPVVDTPFVVTGGVARAVGASIVSDPGFEANNNRWLLMDHVSYDTKVFHGSGGRSVKLPNSAAGSMERLSLPVSNLAPHRAYRMSFWLKTVDYDAPLWIQILRPTGGQPIYTSSSGDGKLGWGSTNGVWDTEPHKIAKNQDWTRYNLDFNTGNENGLRLYLGSWANGTSTGGAAWIDDVDIREIGLAHTVRRQDKSLPIGVTSVDGGKTYLEGYDYSYSEANGALESLAIPPSSNIKDGQELRVSAYQSARNMINRGSAPASICDGSFYTIQKAYFDKIHALLKAPGQYFLYYDENRVLNWDKACGKPSAGAYLAEMTAKHREALLTAYPDLELYTWNDMYDPTMNALPVYYAVNGSLDESWLGLDKKTVIVNWNTNSAAVRVASLSHFHGLGNKQMIAAYYDDATLENVKTWLAALDAAQAQGVSGVDGFMYTTWKGNDGYGKLEAVADMLKAGSAPRWPQ